LKVEVKVSLDQMKQLQKLVNQEMDKHRVNDDYTSGGVPKELRDLEQALASGINIYTDGLQKEDEKKWKKKERSSYIKPTVTSN